MLQRFAAPAVPARTIRTGTAHVGHAQEPLVQRGTTMRHRAVLCRWNVRETQWRRRIVVLDGDWYSLTGQNVRVSGAEVDFQRACVGQVAEILTAIGRAHVRGGFVEEGAAFACFVLLERNVLLGYDWVVVLVGGGVGV